MLELLSCRWLSHEVGGILICVNFLHLDFCGIESISNPMVANLNVFCPCMKPLILCKTNSTLAVTLNCHKTLLKTQVACQSSKPNNLLCNFCQCHILRLCC